MSALEDTFAAQLAWSDLPAPVREYPFAKELKRRFRADFAWPEWRLLVELEGGIFAAGRTGHSSIAGIKRDIDKANVATLLGWRVLRFHHDHVRDGTALQMVERVLREGVTT